MGVGGDDVQNDHNAEVRIKTYFHKPRKRRREEVRDPSKRGGGEKEKMETHTS